MYLKELEIFGFKSFPEKISLKFESGITVVVGPNGCGKSNIFDAIKWALGEQSPKSLRGSKMEDIIFNGTENHPPLNYTEVTLIFCNEDKYLPIGYKEVSVCRRLYRSGESQYFINKNVTRLKDIEELFIGTGIGEATYSFVEQGKIEIFLSYKPEDKRLIFDEASGIVKYKERKKETLRKLEEAEENLLRLNDILSEVQRQIGYLERQVEKAKKYKEIQGQLREIEKKIAGLKIAGLEENIDKLKKELAVFQEKEQEKNTQLKEVNAKWQELNSKLKSLRGKSEQAATTVVSLRTQIENHNSHIAISRQRIEELKIRNQNLQITKINLKERLKLQEERIKEETAGGQDIEKRSKELETQITELETQKNNLEVQSEKAKREINTEKSSILNLESQKANRHNILVEVKTKLSSLVNRKKRLILDKAKLQTLLDENHKRFKVKEEEVLKLEGSLSVRQEKRNNLTCKDKELISISEALKSKLIDQEKELLELNTGYEFLKDLRLKYEVFSAKKKITVIFDEKPRGINKLVASLEGAEFKENNGFYQAQIEAKVISFDEDQLRQKITSRGSQIGEIKLRIRDLEKERNSLSEVLGSENVQIEKIKAKFQESVQEKNTLKREVERLKEEAELLTKEENAAGADIEDFQKKQKSIEDELSCCEGVLNEAKENLLKNQEIITSGSEKIKEIDIEITRKDVQKQSLQREKQALASKINLLEDEANNASTSLKEAQKEYQENDLRLSSLDKQIEQLQTKISENSAKIDEDTKEKENIDQEELLLNNQSDNLKQSLQRLEAESKNLKESTYNKKLQVQSLEYEQKRIKDYLRQVYNIEFEPQPQPELKKSLDELVADKEELQKKQQCLGEVNLVAIEEFEELKKRQDFLEGQKLDLITAKENLKKAIAKINRTSKELFLDTFSKIEQEFKKNFKFLFSGGRANLVLLDKDNVLESGVEIEVQPPGKKLQNVSLLSGGEKSLTAIALIFAIFRVRPSPLCVLDEIDAPLDEANVDRFNQLLKDFATNSQFVIITHNKRTMGNAAVLYGVTMQERGVSKLVSVKFAAEKAPA